MDYNAHTRDIGFGASPNDCL
ncbi:MAG: hypothetical protein COB74_01275 [Shewanella sp.]|nr:MAG: hypothetical protein COB74_01275 [Shewanella sp.]